MEFEGRSIYVSCSYRRGKQFVSERADRASWFISLNPHEYSFVAFLIRCGLRMSLRIPGSSSNVDKGVPSSAHSTHNHL